jgi:hypothetical protein
MGMCDTIEKGYLLGALSLLSKGGVRVIQLGCDYGEHRNYRDRKVARCVACTHCEQNIGDALATRARIRAWLNKIACDEVGAGCRHHRLNAEYGNRVFPALVCTHGRDTHELSVYNQQVSSDSHNDTRETGVEITADVCGGLYRRAGNSLSRAHLF